MLLGFKYLIKGECVKEREIERERTRLTQNVAGLQVSDERERAQEKRRMLLGFKSLMRGRERERERAQL